MTWIPGPIYNSLPYIYILAGIVCLFQNPSPWTKIFYLFSGVVFILAGLLVISWRWGNRRLLSRLKNCEDSPIAVDPFEEDTGQFIDITKRLDENTFKEPLDGRFPPLK
jgi:hypothetical protein